MQNIHNRSPSGSEHILLLAHNEILLIIVIILVSLCGKPYLSNGTMFRIILFVLSFAKTINKSIHNFISHTGNYAKRI